MILHPVTHNNVRIRIKFVEIKNNLSTYSINIKDALNYCISH